MNKEITKYINEALPIQKEMMTDLRKLIHETVPGVTEEFKWSRPVFRSTKDFAYFKSAKSYLTLGFFNYSNLKDENNLLEGTGKDMRHIKLKTQGQIDKSLLKEWFKVSSGN